MKAEHRKELETNVLADRMGRLVQQMKAPKSGRWVLYLVLGFVVLVAGFIFYTLRLSSRIENMEQWLSLENGSFEVLAKLADMREDPKTRQISVLSRETATEPAKAARFHMARFFVWDQGVRMLGANPAGALQSIRFAERIYRELDKECQDDPSWHAEALYGLALVEETLAIQNPDRLKGAQKQYEALKEKYGETGFGKLADQRLKALKDNGDEIAKVYRDLQTNFRVPDEKAILPKAAP